MVSTSSFEFESNVQTDVIDVMLAGRQATCCAVGAAGAAQHLARAAFALRDSWAIALLCTAALGEANTVTGTQESAMLHQPYDH